MKKLKVLLGLALALCASAVLAVVQPCNIGADPENLARKAVEGEERWVLTENTPMTVGSKSGKKTACEMPRGTPVWINSVTGKVVWVENCGNTVFSDTIIPRKENLVRGPGSVTTLNTRPTCEGKEQCEAFEWCDKNKGWKFVASDDGRKRSVCEFPGTDWVINQKNTGDINISTTWTGRHNAYWEGWKGNAKLDIPAPPQAVLNVAKGEGPAVNFGGTSSGTVSGKQCGPVSCDPFQVGNVVAIEASPDNVCRIVARDPKGVRHLIALGKDKESGNLLITLQGIGGAFGGKEMDMKVVRTDCVAIIKEVSEGRSPKGASIWEMVRQGLGLPDLCTIEKGQNGRIVPITRTAKG